jgi:Zn-dependent peptidase ImmA (M78 family)
MPRDEEHKSLHGMIHLGEEPPWIMVNRNLSNKQQALTLLHEVCHAILDPLGLRAQLDERIVERLEAGLASAFQENPTFFRQLISLLCATRSR